MWKGKAVPAGWWCKDVDAQIYIFLARDAGGCEKGMFYAMSGNELELTVRVVEAEVMNNLTRKMDGHLREIELKG